MCSHVTVKSPRHPATNRAKTHPSCRPPAEAAESFSDPCVEDAHLGALPQLGHDARYEAAVLAAAGRCVQYGVTEGALRLSSS